MLEALRSESLAGEGQGDGMTSQRGNWSQGHRAVDLSPWEQGVHQALSQVHLEGDSGILEPARTCSLHFQEFHELVLKTACSKAQFYKLKIRDFPDSPVVKTLPSNAGVYSLVRQLRSHMPHNQKQTNIKSRISSVQFSCSVVSDSL